MFHDIPGGPQNDCRNSCLLELTGNQTHGLVTYGSQGNQHHRSNFGFQTTPNDRRTILLERFTLTVFRG